MPTLSSKGQITVLKAVRDKLGLKPGDRIEFVIEPSGRYALPGRSRDIRSLKGIVKSSLGRPVTIEEMNQAGALCAVVRWERSTV